MTMLLSFLLLILDTCSSKQTTPKIRTRRNYSADWRDLDRRPLPQWYDEAKFGIFIHWGVYSVPSYGSEWFWFYLKGKNKLYVEFMKENYPKGFTYEQFAPMFKAKNFNPEKWADLFVTAGAKYVVLTTKHHDGYTLFPSKTSPNWNSMEIGPQRDLVGDLAKAVKAKGLKFGVYYSLLEWYPPLSFPEYVDKKMFPELKQVVNSYKPSIVWADGHWNVESTDYNSTKFLSWLYNESPVKDEVVVNDRWGKDCSGQHGDFYNFQDRYNKRKLVKHKWENAFTLDTVSWGYRREMKTYEVLNISRLIDELVTTVSCNGNALMNIGPTEKGTIVPIFEERLHTLGKWLSINGEAIYGTTPCVTQRDTYNKHVWYTCKWKHIFKHLRQKVPKNIQHFKAVYAVALNWPKNNLLRLRDITPYLRKAPFEIELLGNSNIKLNWTFSQKITLVKFPKQETLKSENAWTLRFTSKNDERQHFSLWYGTIKH